MSDAFAAAAAALAEDANLGQDATFLPASGGSYPVRVVPVRPADAFSGLEGPPSQAIATSVMVPLAALPAPARRNDRLLLAGVYFLIAEAEVDSRGVSQVLRLRR
jgi:hypothetical protein